MKKLLLLLVFINIGQVSAQCNVLLDFAGATNGSTPGGDLFYDGTYLYGMTAHGGINDSGTIFKIKPDGTGFIKLFDFTAIADGRYPFGSLISDGTFLYGMTQQGGTNSLGTIFKIMPDGSGYLKLFDFSGTPNGRMASGSLIYDGAFLYGMADGGGTNNDGTIFKIKPDGTGFIKLFDFVSATTGANPTRSLISDGTFLYGMTYRGGTHNAGTIFKIMPNGAGFDTLLNFNYTNGSNPEGTLFFDGTFLYGTTQMGGISTNCGIYGCGTIFKIKPDGSGYAKLLDFGGTTNGSIPYCALIFDGTFLYGMTSQGGTNTTCFSGCGTAFKIKPNGSGFVKLLDFVDATTGSGPLGSLISDGTSLYGMTKWGGANNDGTIFKLDSTGVGVEQLSAKDKQIIIYPNPTNGVFIIKSNTTDKQTLDLYDVNGRHVFSKTVVGTANIDASSLDNGIYTLTIKNNAGITNKKLIIVH